MTRSELAPMIDHTALKPETTRDQVLQLCREAREHQFGAVCVAASWVSPASDALNDTPVKVASVVGFPHGNTLSVVKRFEAAQAIEAGADELDMVLPVGLLKSGDEEAVLADIGAVVEAARAKPGVLVKVILETALLEENEKVRACQLAEQAGADFVKTSTGFGPAGATLADVRLMRQAVGDRLGVKAAGGIRTLETALAMIDAGANRLGCSASIEIVNEFQNG